MLILAINPGSTSTKIGIFNDETLVNAKTVQHSAAELSAFPTLIDQLDYRKRLIEEAVREQGLDAAAFDGYIGRGGLLRPIEGGVYKVNDDMLRDLRNGLQGIHASNLGGLLASALAKEAGKDAYIADPVVVDELMEVARVTGHPLIKKHSIFHALNHKAIARRHCRERGLSYDAVNLVVVHMGGGVSVGAHERGKVVDVNNALEGEGPFSPERCGSLPARRLIDLCYSGEYTKNEALAMIQPRGGLVAYFGVNDFRELCEKAQTDAEAKLILDGMSYKIAREIGAAATTMRGNVDAILLTGGMARSDYLVNYITERCAYIAEVCVYPGEDELTALAENLLLVLRQDAQAKHY